MAVPLLGQMGERAVEIIHFVFVTPQLLARACLILSGVMVEITLCTAGAICGSSFTVAAADSLEGFNQSVSAKSSVMQPSPCINRTHFICLASKNIEEVSHIPVPILEVLYVSITLRMTK